MSMTSVETMSVRDQAERAMRHSWWPVARSSDLGDEPVPAVLLGERLAVFRGDDGIARVLANRCPHRGGSLGHGKVHGNDIACPYHGWRFSGESGGCTKVPSLDDQSRIPKTAGVKTHPVVERYGHVWTCLEDPAVPMYDLLEWQDIDLEWLAAEPIVTDRGVAIAIENFRDVAHFPFVHWASMGPSPEVVEPLHVRREGLDVFMDRPLDAGSGEWAEQGDCMMRYHCIAPGLAAITYDYEKLGQRVVAGFPSPVAYDEATIFWAVANEVGFKGDSLEKCLHIETAVYLEDVPIAGRIEPKEVPWDKEVVEESVAADLFTVNYRRAFRSLIDKVTASYSSAP
jgi:phenylpropionate dioxygenase-like ring-hydroxylating dioxygenase large terminal subunit